MPDFKFEIGEAQIQNAIAIGIAESFSSEKKDSIIRDVVRAHLSVKENSYSKETLLSRTVGDMIRKIAADVLEKEIEKLRPSIEETVRNVLGDGFEKTICDQLKSGLIARQVSGIKVNILMEGD